MEIFLEQFQEFSKELQLSSAINWKAYKFLKEILPIYIKCGQTFSKKALFACSVFIAVQDNFCPFDPKADENSSQPEITVTQLLEKADINIMDFFFVTCFLKKNYALTENVKQNLIALERKYLVVSALYDKFESMTDEIFFGDSKDSPIPITNVNSDVDRLLKNHKALCWMLFLVAKAKVLWHRQELLATFHLLLCCIGEVIKVTPSFLLLPPFDSAVAKDESSVNVLEVLSNHFRTKFEEVKAVHDGWLHVASELKVEDKLPQFDVLHSIYSKLYSQTGDIDESLFLLNDCHLLPPASTDQNHSPRKCVSASIRITLDTSEALNTILYSAPDGLSSSLSQLLQRISSFNAPSLINGFLTSSKANFIKEFVQAQEGGDLNLAERRFRLATRYYYLMLDALLKKESERLSLAEFSSFVMNMPFHRSLLACCLEVTLMSCGSVGSVNFTPLPHGGKSQAQGLVFPWIARVFNLEAFDVFKIIDTFIKGAPTITMQIINHLKAIEHKILESLAWESGSSVFKGLSGSGCSPSCRARYDSPSQSPGLWSPNKDNAQRTPSTPHVCQAISKFMNKVCRLAYQRLEEMRAYLKLDKEMEGKIWICIEHVLYKKTQLLMDRHLDQIIMCCIFAVCKIQDKDIRFKDIVGCYDTLAHSSVSVYKQVLSSGKKEYIVKFYNKEFHSEMEDYIVNKFGSNNKGASSSITVPQSPVVLSPFYSLPSKKNIFISPLQKSPFKNPNEIIYRKLPSYTFGSLTQSTKMLQDINGSLNMPSSTKGKVEEKGKKRLVFDSADSVKKELYSSARKFLKFDEPESSVSFTKPKSFEENTKK